MKFCRVGVLLWFGACVLLAVGMGGAAYGAGFALIEQSVPGLGNAFAGGSAAAEDATTIFYNPAGLTVLDGPEFVVGAHMVVPQAEFTDKGSTHMLQAVTGIPLSGTNGGDGGKAGVVPNLYYSRPFGEDLVFGLGVNAPFGLATEYDRDWVGRYHAVESDVKTLNINPTLAVRLSERLSVGFGVNIQYIEATLSNAIDFGSLDAAGVFAPLGIPAGALGLVPQMSDGFVKVEGDDWSVGFNAGLLYQFSAATRVGLSYRSQVHHNLDGTARFSDVPAGLAPAPLFKNTGVEAAIGLPDVVSASIYHQLNSAWAVMGDITWTNWSVLDELRVEFDNPLQEDGVTTTAWDDNYRYSVGATYTPSERWTARCGVAFDETPIPDAAHRTPRIPGEDRLWIALGGGYQITDHIRIDAAYAHLFIDDPVVAKTLSGENISRGGLNGTYDASVDIANVQLTWSF